MASPENLGVTAVERIIARTDRLVPSFNRNDKGLSWDGDIEIYHHAGNNHKKDDFAGRIPVQIKGRSCDNLEDVKKSFPVEMADLRNYLQDGGTIFFVVFITDEDESVYYRSLLPFELKKILKKYGTQESRTISLKPFPKDKKVVEELVFNLLNDRDKQRAAISAEPLTLKDVAKDGELHTLSLGYVATNGDYNMPFDYFFEHGTYLYVNLPFGLSLPVEHIERINEASTEIKQDVYVGDKLYFHQYRATYKKDTLEISFGKCLRFINPRNGEPGTVNFNIQGTLSERINSLDFLISAIKASEIIIDGEHYNFFDISEEEKSKIDISDMMENLEYLEKVQKTLNTLHVKKDLECDNITKVDEYNIDKLVSAITDKNLIRLKDAGYPFGKYSFCNINLYVCVIKDKDSGLFRLYDILDAPIVFKGKDNKGRDFDSSICVKFDGKTLLGYDNLDHERIIENLSKIKPSEAYSQQLTLFLLEILKTYDELKLPTHPLLSLAKKLSELILDKYTFSDQEISELNFLQIVLRERAFNADEIGQLNDIVKTAVKEKKHFILAGAYILLNNQEESKKHYYLMADDDRDEFDRYPINRFRSW